MEELGYVVVEVEIANFGKVQKSSVISQCGFGCQNLTCKFPIQVSEFKSLFIYFCHLLKMLITIITCHIPFINFDCFCKITGGQVFIFTI